MTDHRQLRALVVDDEPVVRQATARSLSRVGFACETAQDGAEAWTLAKAHPFDLVITDLRMPEVNGHQLAVDLLALPNRPALAILTGIVEPKLAADLKARGVDEILFKPIEFDDLARRMLSLVDSRAAKTLAKTTEVDATPAIANSVAEPAVPAQLAAQLAHAASELRHPPTDFDAFARASANSFNTKNLVSAVEANPSFVVEVLRLTNTMVYTSSKSLSEIKDSMEAMRRGAFVRSIALFASGALLGGIISWFAAAASAWR